MLASLVYPLALLTAALTALGTGSLFAFSSFVMGALNRLAPAEAIAAMQSINIVVVNPLFIGAYMGAAVCFGVVEEARCDDDYAAIERSWRIANIFKLECDLAVGAGALKAILAVISA